MPAEVTGSSWGSICIPAGRVRGGSGHGASSGGSRRLLTSVSPPASSNERCERHKQTSFPT